MGPPKKSSVWLFFTKTACGRKCNLCLLEVKTKGNTTNLSRHLKRHHKNANIGSESDTPEIMDISMDQSSQEIEIALEQGPVVSESSTGANEPGPSTSFAQSTPKRSLVGMTGVKQPQIDNFISSIQSFKTGDPIEVMDAVKIQELQSDPGGIFVMPEIKNETESDSEQENVKVPAVTLTMVKPGLLKCEYESDPEYDDELRDVIFRKQPEKPTNNSEAKTADGTQINPEDSEEPVQPYACSQCDSSFEQLSELSEHVNSHTKKKRTNKKLRLKHSEVRLPYRCSACRVGFSDLIELSKHTRNTKVHDREFEMFVCAECRLSFRGFRNMAAIKEHLRKHTGKMPVDVTIDDNC